MQDATWVEKKTKKQKKQKQKQKQKCGLCEI